MRTLIKSALIQDKRSPLHGKTRDLLIEDNLILKIGAKITEKADRIISGKKIVIMPGAIDLRANFRDPGQEEKEDIHTGLSAAKAGGFKYVVVMPSTTPITDNKAAIEYLVRKSESHSTILLPTGALSIKMEGKQLAEMYDMQCSGAVAFTDDKKNVSTEMMVRALEYASNIDSLIMSFPFDPGVNPGGLINEGKISVETGMKGISNAAEEVRLSRDIELLRYCGGSLHVSLISTAGSVDKIRKAKKEGLSITCSIAAHQLMYTDADLASFDSNYKVFPPFRSKADQKALISGLKDGTIDGICSDHSPEDHEHKVLEFEYAAFGISSIQTTIFTAIHALLPHMPLEDILDKFTLMPAQILHLEYPAIIEGSTAALTILDLETEQSFGRDIWKSKSIFNPMYGLKIKGAVLDVI